MPLAMMVNDSIQDLTSLLEKPVVPEKKPSGKAAAASPQEANPQQPPSVFFRYAGQYEYSDGYYYQPHHHSSSPSLTPIVDAAAAANKDHHRQQPVLGSTNRQASSSSSTGSRTNHVNPLLGCLFPWIFKEQQHQQQQHHPTQTTPWLEHEDNDSSDDEYDGNHDEEDAKSDTDASNNSNLLGEKLSQRERLAVLNRLRLPVDAQQQLTTMDTTTTTTNSSSSSGTTSGNSSSRNSKKNLLNGIPVQATSPLEMAPTTPRPLKGILKLSDSVMAVTTSATSSPTKQQVISLDDSTRTSTTSTNRRSLFPTTYEKRTNKAVSFAAMARVVTVKSKNDMDAAEKADVWWQRTDYEEFRRTGRIITKSNNVLSNAGLLPSQQHHQQQQDPLMAVDTIPLEQTKWWHSFGHSRRGLEHVVSVDEGRQRQENVKAAIAAILKEQSRNSTDSEKLRAVSLNYTSWARDLAEAAAASDADAVVRSFGEDRKSREFFLLKQAQRQQQKYNGQQTIVPDFMQPRTKTKLQQRMLDANISRRPMQRRPLSSSSQQQQHATATTSSGSSLNSTVVAVKDGDDDAIEGLSDSTMAQQAAGFAADGKKHDMAAVLAGAATAVN